MSHLSIRLLSIWVYSSFLLSGFVLSDEAFAQHRLQKFEDLVDSSELVISGVIVDKFTYREPILIDTFSSDGKGGSIKRIETWDEILTDYEIKVGGVYRGKYSQSTIRLTVVGGTIDGTSLDTSESFSLTTGNKYYFFLLYEERNDKWWAMWHQKGVFEEVELKGKKVIRGINRRTVIGRDGDLISNFDASDKDFLNVEQFVSHIKAATHE